MICFAVKNGVPFDVAHSMEYYELLSYLIVFGQFENPNLEWDWDRMQFFENKK